MSPNGEFVAITVMNGSQRPKDHQAYNDHGLVKMYRIDGTKLSYVTQAKVGGWGQGVAWSTDGKTMLFQAMLTKELQNTELRRQGSAGDRRRQGSGRPGRHPHSRALNAARPTARRMRWAPLFRTWMKRRGGRRRGRRPPSAVSVAHVGMTG